MAGLPDVDTLSSYGGALQNDHPVEDAVTDEESGWRNLYAANVAAMTQTACRAWCAFVGDAATPGDPVSHVHGAVWGNLPAVKPAATKGGTGVYVLTFPSTVDDELGMTHSVNLRHAWASVSGAQFYHHTETITAPNVVEVRVWNGASALSDAVGVTFTVFAI